MHNSCPIKFKRVLKKGFCLADKPFRVPTLELGKPIMVYSPVLILRLHNLSKTSLIEDLSCLLDRSVKLLFLY